MGLGNPGKDYENTRHNAGRMATQTIARINKFSKWENDKKRTALKAGGFIAKEKVTALLPETYMNKSGKSALGLKPKTFIIIHDDLDLTMGRFKITFGRNSGGHKGLESVMRALKTKDFIRIRVGISPKKKPPADKISDFILKKFTPNELLMLKKVFKNISKAVEVMIGENLQKAMSLYN